MRHDAVDPARFRAVLGRFPTGVTIITARAPAAPPAGLAVGSFFSVSLDPPLVGFCAGKGSSSWPSVRAAGSFCVNVLADDQGDLCARFSTKGADKFAELDWAPGATGAPRLDGALAWIDCDVDAVHDAGDHEICIGWVRDLVVAREAGPLLFWGGRYGRFDG